MSNRIHCTAHAEAHSRFFSSVTGTKRLYGLDRNHNRFETGQLRNWWNENAVDDINTSRRDLWQKFYH